MQLWWVLGIALLVMATQALIYRLASRKRLDYAAWFAVGSAYVGDSLELVEQISNRKWLPLPWVRLESSFDLSLQFAGHQDVRIARGQQYHQFHRSVFSLPMMTRITRRHPITCTQRGVYQLTGTVMTVGDLLGSREVSQHVALNSELVVYPAVLRLDALPWPAHRWLGEVLVRRWVVDDPFYTSGSRAYIAGDSLRDINWKATARTGSLMVHQHDFTADSRLLLLVNVEDSPEMWDTQTHPERIEAALTLAATIAYQATVQGAEVGFASNGTAGGDQAGMAVAGGLGGDVVQTEVSSGSQHLTLLLETMARMTLARTVGFSRLLAAFVEAGLTGADLLVLTEFVDAPLAEAIADLRSAGNAVEVYGAGEGGNDAG